MNISEIFNLDIKGKNILIIGPPASGKSYFTELFDTKNHIVIHTDEYKQFGYQESLYKIIDDLKNIQGNTIIEGVQGYRLLRKGAQLNCYYPDIVIELEISDEQMQRTYKNERDEKKFRYLKHFNANHQKILNDYFALANDKKPIWYKVFNKY